MRPWIRSRKYVLVEEALRKAQTLIDITSFSIY
jgi:hypothetical protein